jgi:hypothetical protein
MRTQMSANDWIIVAVIALAAWLFYRAIFGFRCPNCGVRMQRFDALMANDNRPPTMECPTLPHEGLTCVIILLAYPQGYLGPGGNGEVSVGLANCGPCRESRELTEGAIGVNVVDLRTCSRRLPCEKPYREWRLCFCP